MQGEIEKMREMQKYDNNFKRKSVVSHLLWKSEELLMENIEVINKEEAEKKDGKTYDFYDD